VPLSSLDHQSPDQPGDEAPGRPGSCIFPELPSPHSWVAPCLRCAAFPAAHLRVAPQCAPFGCAGNLIGELPRVSHPISAAAGEVSGRPDAAPATAPLMSFRVAPSAASSGCASGESAGRPASSLLWRCCRIGQRVASPHASFSGAGGEFSDCSETSPPALPPCVFGFPRVLHRRPGR